MVSEKSMEPVLEVFETLRLLLGGKRLRGLTAGVASLEEIIKGLVILGRDFVQVILGESAVQGFLDRLFAVTNGVFHDVALLGEMPKVLRTSRHLQCPDTLLHVVHFVYRTRSSHEGLRLALLLWDEY